MNKRTPNKRGETHTTLVILILIVIGLALIGLAVYNLLRRAGVTP